MAKHLFFTPPHAPLRADERKVLASGESFVLVPSAGRHRLAGRVWGEGPAVLLLHGWGGHSGQMTPLVEPLLAAGFRVATIDAPGHGESSGRLSSLVHFSTALARAAALFGPLRGLVAHSFGAAGATFALSRGLAVESCVYFAPPARFDTFWTRFRSGVGVSEDIWRLMVREAEDWLGESFDDMAPRELAPRMTSRLLVLHDPEDREMPFEEGAELAASWPGARFTPVAGLGHLRILRDPRCIEEAVSFLANPS